MKKLTSGKVRDLYEVDSSSLMLVVSDRISAFDNIMPVVIPDKGILLNKLSAFWFDYISEIVENHVISKNYDEYPDDFKRREFRGRSMLVKKLNMLPIECVVRGYISGSAWKEYQSTGTICGQVIRPGMKESEKFIEAIFTPAKKAEVGEHDENISFDQTIKIIGLDLAEKVKRISLEVYNKCAKHALSKGIIMADTKFEFGLDEEGNLILGDEIMTPDSSRFWPLEKYIEGKEQESFDKQYLRNWLKENGFEDSRPREIPKEVIEITKDNYIKCYEILTDRSFKDISRR